MEEEEEESRGVLVRELKNCFRHVEIEVTHEEASDDVCMDRRQSGSRKADP